MGHGGPCFAAGKTAGAPIRAPPMGVRYKVASLMNTEITVAPVAVNAAESPAA